MCSAEGNEKKQAGACGGTKCTAALWHKERDGEEKTHK